MTVVLCIIIAVLMLVIALLMASLGYFAGRAKAVEENDSKEAAILTFLAHYSGAKDPEEPESDPDPVDVESSENKN